MKKILFFHITTISGLLKIRLLLLYGSSFVSFSQAEVLSEKGQILQLIEIGRKEMEAGNQVAAFKSISSAQKYSQAIGDDELYYKASIELANFYIMKNRMDEAEDVFSKIYPRSYFDPEDNCRYYHRRAFYFNQNGSLDSARYCSLVALEIAKRNNIDNVQGLIYNELGNIYERYRIWDSSLYYYNQAIAKFDTNSVDFVNASFNRARTYYEFNDFDSSIFYSEQVVAKIQDSELYTILSPLYNFMAHSYFKTGDSLSGYKYKWLADQTEVKVMLKVHDSELEKLEAEYGAERKQIEVHEQKVQLKLEKEEKEALFLLIFMLVAVLLIFFIFLFVIRNKNKRLKKLLSENEFLVGEANHRIKNNLQIIVSLVAREMYKRDDQEIDALRNIGSKIESIATLHQQLYINEEKNEINLSNYLSSLTENLKPIYEAKNIKLEFEIEDLLLYSVSKSIYIGLLFNELIINSIKHAFADNQSDARITVKFHKAKSDKISFEYADNGMGIKAGVKPKLIDMMCRQLKSKYEMDGSKGYKFRVVV